MGKYLILTLTLACITAAGVFGIEESSANVHAGSAASSNGKPRGQDSIINKKGSTISASKKQNNNKGDVYVTPAMFLSSKTPYWPQQIGPREEMPSHCKLIHINHLARHGSRHSNKLSNIKRLLFALREARKQGYLRPAGVALLAAVSEFAVNEKLNLGLLTENGKKEHKGQAMRIWDRHSVHLRNALLANRSFVFEASDKIRTKGSRAAFVEGFLTSARNALSLEEQALHLPPEHYMGSEGWEVDPANGMEVNTLDPEEVENSLYADPEEERVLDNNNNNNINNNELLQPGSAFQFVTPSQCDRESNNNVDINGVVAAAPSSSSSSHLAFSRLRFFDSCKRYTAYKNEKGWIPRILKYTENATKTTSHEWAMLSNLFSNPYLEILVRRQKEKNATTATLSTQQETACVEEEQEQQGDTDGKEEETESSTSSSTSWTPKKAAKQAKKQQTLAQRRTEATSGKKPQQQQQQSRGGSGDANPFAAAIKEKELSISIASLTIDLYKTCQIDLNAYGQADRICSVFKQHMQLMAKAELITDLADYYKQGAGEPVAFLASCVLMEDFLAAGDEGAKAAVPFSTSRTAIASSPVARPLSSPSLAPPPPPPAGHFRFGHSETVMPFISFMGLYQTPGSTSLDDYYKKELAQGTSNLLSYTYSRVNLLQEARNEEEENRLGPNATTVRVHPETAIIPPEGLAHMLHEAFSPSPIPATSSNNNGNSNGSRSPAATASAAQQQQQLHHQQSNGSSSNKKNNNNNSNNHNNHNNHHHHNNNNMNNNNGNNNNDNHNRALPPGFSVAHLMALKHPWSGARLVPMASNIQWLMYDCGSGGEEDMTDLEEIGRGIGEAPAEDEKKKKEEKVEENDEAEDVNRNLHKPQHRPISTMRGVWMKMLHNEREIQFPACTAAHMSSSDSINNRTTSGGSSSSGSSSTLTGNTSSHAHFLAEKDMLLSGTSGENPSSQPFGLQFPCPWETVKQYYSKTVYEKYGLSSCSAADWEKMCGPNDSSGCEDSAD